LFDRCTCTKGLKLGLNLSLSAYNTFALPVLSHVAQCCEPSKLVHVKAREGLQRLTNAPRYAFSPLALRHMKKIGLECEAQEVRVTASAALLRAATRSDAFWRMKDWLAEIREDDDQCIARVISFPSSNSIVAHMNRAVERYHPVPGFPHGVRPKLLQNRITKFLKPEFFPWTHCW
jgi:hypothetical protein